MLVEGYWICENDCVNGLIEKNNEILEKYRNEYGEVSFALDHDDMKANMSEDDYFQFSDNEDTIHAILSPEEWHYYLESPLY